MPLDFPTSPTNGQQYGGYTYNSTIGAWQTNTSTVAPATVTDTRPTNPTNGDMWFNTADGTLYFYYNDGSSAQWVEARAPITNDGYYSPNYILNSAFDIWQRGTSGTPTSAATRYVADRWETFRTAYATGLTVSRQTAIDATLLPNIQYCMRVQRTAANAAVDVIRTGQAFETINSIPLAGKTVTLSFYARAGANYSSASSALSVQVVTGTGTDQSLAGTFTGTATPISQTATLTTSWQRFSYTGLLATNITQAGVIFFYTPVGTAGTNDYFEITGVQLEESAAAMPFHRQTPSIQAELAACQRYYYKAWDGSTDFQLITTRYSTTQCAATLWLPVTMRVNPTLVATPSGGLYGRVVGYDTSFNVTTSGVSAISVNTANAPGTGAAAPPSGNQIDMYMTHSAVAGTYVQLSFDTFSYTVPLALSAEL